jgi:hypothetical protein
MAIKLPKAMYPNQKVEQKYSCEVGVTTESVVPVPIHVQTGCFTSWDIWSIIAAVVTEQWILVTVPIISSAILWLARIL